MRSLKLLSHMCNFTPPFHVSYPSPPKLNHTRSSATCSAYLWTQLYSYVSLHCFQCHFILLYPQIQRKFLLEILFMGIVIYFIIQIFRFMNLFKGIETKYIVYFKFCTIYTQKKCIIDTMYNIFFKMHQNIQYTLYKRILNISYYVQVYNILPTSGSPRGKI